MQFIAQNNVRARRVAALALCAGLLLAGCTAVVRTPGGAIVYHDAPAPIVEIVPVAPGPGWHWVPGHYAWRAGAWRWVPGHYVRGVVPVMPRPLAEEVVPSPGPRYAWVRGHWEWDNDHWEWHRGMWVPR